MGYPVVVLATALAYYPLFADTLSLTPISTVRNNGDAADLFDASAAEIVKFDPASKRMLVVNGATNSIDIFDAANPSAPGFVKSIGLSVFGNPNSVAVNPNAALNEIAMASARMTRASAAAWCSLPKTARPLVR